MLVDLSYFSILGLNVKIQFGRLNPSKYTYPRPSTNLMRTYGKLIAYTMKL